MTEEELAAIEAIVRDWSYRDNLTRWLVGDERRDIVEIAEMLVTEVRRLKVELQYVRCAGHITVRRS